MRRTLRHCLHASVWLGVASAGVAWARDLPNVDALSATQADRAKVAKLRKAAPASVQRLTYDEQLGVATFLWLDPARAPAFGKEKSGPANLAQSARAELKAVAELYGVSAAEVDAAPVKLDQALAQGGRVVQLTNQRDGIPVFREQATVLLDRRGVALNVGGFIGSTGLAKTAGITKAAAARTPALAAQVALRDFDFQADAARQLVDAELPSGKDADGYRQLSLPESLRGGQGATLEAPIRYRRVWFRMPQGLVPAFYLELRVLEAGVHNAYSYVVASDDGRLLFRNNLTSHQAAPATPTAAAPLAAPRAFGYGVWAHPETGVPYPGPQGLDLNPYPGSGPDGYSARLVSPSRLRLASAPFSKADPWVDSSIHPRLSFTYGNNVRAWADVKSPDGFAGAPFANIASCPENSRSVDGDFFACSSTDAFDYGYEPSADAVRNQGQASTSVANLFYMVNWLHDWFYDAGFDEASGNAQARNFGRGGIEGDPIDAWALAYSVRNNASMATPADGASPNMRMYVFDKGGPTRSAALDNTIVAHEWGHYLTRRLIGNANGLTTRLGAGLGEGWGDFVAQLVTVTDKDRAKPGNAQFQGAYAQGAYANAGSVNPAVDGSNTAYFGSRRYPYSTDMAKNPLTFKHIQDGEPLPANVPVNHALIQHTAGTGFGNAEIHNVGEVWATMLWECYASILNQREFADAQQRMKNYFVTSLKLTPVNPTFTEARDAVLASMAASDSQDYASCLGAFAKRGAGLDALAPDRVSINLQGVVESYNAGPLLLVDDLRVSTSVGGAMRCDADDLLDNGETAMLTFNLVNRGNTEISGISLAFQSDQAQITFPKGASLDLPDAIAPGKSLAMRVPMTVAGMTSFANAQIGVNVRLANELASARGQTVSAWINADIAGASSTDDPVRVWPGAMNLENSQWAVAGDESGEHWYQVSVPNQTLLTTMYTPEIKASSDTDLILSFDQDYAFAADETNGGQLIVSLPHSLDVGVAAEIVPYTGRIWWTRQGALPNANPLRNQPAFTGRSNGWKRNVTVNFGREYAGKLLRIGWRVGSTANANPDAAQFWRVDNIRFSGVDNRPFASIVAQAGQCAHPLMQVDAVPPAAAPADGSAAAGVAPGAAAATEPPKPAATAQTQGDTKALAPTAIPTLSHAGYALLSILLGGLGHACLGRRSARQKTDRRA